MLVAVPELFPLWLLVWVTVLVVLRRRHAREIGCWALASVVELTLAVAVTTAVLDGLSALVVSPTLARVVAWMAGWCVYAVCTALALGWIEQYRGQGTIRGHRVLY